MKKYLLAIGIIELIAFTISFVWLSIKFVIVATNLGNCTATWLYLLYVLLDLFFGPAIGCLFITVSKLMPAKKVTQKVITDEGKYSVGDKVYTLVSKKAIENNKVIPFGHSGEIIKYEGSGIYTVKFELDFETVTAVCVENRLEKVN